MHVYRAWHAQHASTSEPTQADIGGMHAVLAISAVSQQLVVLGCFHVAEAWESGCREAAAPSSDTPAASSANKKLFANL